MAHLGVAVAQPTERYLGTPVKALSVRSSILVRDSVTQRPVLYTGTYTSTGSASLIEFDYVEGIELYPFPGVKGAYGI